MAQQRPRTALHTLPIRAKCPRCKTIVRLTGSWETLRVDRPCEHLCTLCTSAREEVVFGRSPCRRELVWRTARQGSYQYITREFTPGEVVHFPCPRPESGCQGSLVDVQPRAGTAVGLTFRCRHVLRCRTPSHRRRHSSKPTCTLVAIHPDSGRPQCGHSSKLSDGEGKPWRDGGAELQLGTCSQSRLNERLNILEMQVGRLNERLDSLESAELGRLKERLSEDKPFSVRSRRNCLDQTAFSPQMSSSRTIWHALWSYGHLQ